MLAAEPEYAIENVPELEVVPEASATRPPGDAGGRISLISTVTPTCGWWFQDTEPTTLAGVAVAVAVALALGAADPQPVVSICGVEQTTLNATVGVAGPVVGAAGGA